MVINNSKIARGALYILAFLINFEMINLFGDQGQLSIGRIGGYIYICTFLYIKYRIQWDDIKKLSPFFIIFIGVILASSALHLTNNSLVLFDMSLLQNIVLFFLLISHERYDPGVLEKSFFAFSLGAMLSSILYLLNFGIEYEEGRVTIFGDNENAIGIRMAIACIYCIYIFISNKRMFSIVSIIIILVPSMLFLMLGTGSRVAFISFCLMYLLILLADFFTHPLKKGWRFVLYLTLSFFMLVPSMLSNELLNNRLILSSKGDLAGRENIWPAYLSVVEKSPLIGYGYSGFNEVSQYIFGGLVSPHNVVIEILLYGGYIALIAFISFILYLIFIGISCYQSQKKYIGLIFMISYLGLFFSGQVLHTKIMWIILALNYISSYYKMAPKKKGKYVCNYIQ